MKHIKALTSASLKALQPNSSKTPKERPAPLLTSVEPNFLVDPKTEPEKQGMVNEALRFCAAMRDNEPEHWLTLLGNSGTGKTMLAKAIKRYFERYIEGSNSMSREEWLAKGRPAPTYEPGFGGAKLVNWATLIDRRDFEVIGELHRYRFLVIDEIGVDDNSIRLSANKLYHLLNQRSRKWTLITGNKFVDEIEAWDARLSDRLYREGNVLFEIRETPSFQTR